jgi:hypothetical protein
MQPAASIHTLGGMNDLGDFAELRD